ncbi:MAG: DHHA1 domain-containing protein, partial [Microbacterium sp.]
TSESSVGAANRRVEALVGQDAFRELTRERALVTELSSSLKTPRDKLAERVSELAANLKAAEKRIAQFEQQALQQRVPELAGRAAAAGRVVLVAESIGAVSSGDDVRSLVTQVRERLGSEPAVVALAGEAKGRPVVVVATNEGARDSGARAGDLAKAASSVLGGGGGGKPDLAQGGGTDAAAIPAALEAVRRAAEAL